MCKQCKSNRCGNQAKCIRDYTARLEHFAPLAQLGSVIAETDKILAKDLAPRLALKRLAKAHGISL